MLAVAYTRFTCFFAALLLRLHDRLIAWWRGGFVHTRTGARWYPHSPLAEDVCLEDLGSVAHINRFGGHAGLCSVAEHQIRVVELLRSIGCSAWIQLIGAMHDAAEVYPPHDIAAPVFLGNFIHRLLAWPIKRMKRRAEAAVFDRLGLPRSLPPEVRWADLVLLGTEARDRLPGGTRGWTQGREMPEPLSRRIYPMEPADAERRWWRTVATLAVEAQREHGLSPTQVSKLHELADVALREATRLELTADV